MRRNSLMASVAACLALVALAGDAEAQRAQRAPTTDPNEGTVQTQKVEKTFPLGWSWTAVSLNGKQFGSDRPTLQLDENLRGSGYAGCNTYSSTMYPVREQGFAVGPIAVTRKACAKPQADLEKEFLFALRAAQKWDLVSGRLVLTNPRGELVFERAI
ncbi:MAG: META domain-containing protein [Bosea sp. (in: a-proteobacteria)]